MCAAPSSVRFGPFECDLTTGRLSKGGRTLRLQEQPAQILVALLSRAGEVISREELRQRLWSDGTFVAFDNALNVGVRKVREALGDVAPTARYIETVRGHGYRFIAPVTSALPDVEAAVAPAPPQLRPVRQGRPMFTAAILSALVLAALVALRPGATELRVQSLAVIPFENLLEDSGQQYLVDGLSAGIAADLGARTNLRVIGGESTFALQDRRADHPALARLLGVDAVLTGSVAQLGPMVVVNMRLVDSGDRNLWTGRFERPRDELSVPDLLVDAVIGAVGEIAPARALRQRRAALPEARDAYLRGRFFWAKRGQANVEIAVRHFSTAIKLQPDYAEAWAGLADVYAISNGAPSSVIDPWPGDPIAAGVHAAHEALRLAPNMGEAHAALGKLYVGQRRWAEAEASLRRAVELAPEYSTARQWYGTMFLRLLRCDEARAQVEIGARLDPLSALVNEAVGSVHLGCGDPERAIEVFQTVLRMHPDAMTTRNFLGRALIRTGRSSEAIRVLEDTYANSPSETVASTLAIAYAKSGRVDVARERLALVGAPFLRATVFAALLDSESMWAALEDALIRDGGGLQGLLSSTAFEPYRGEQRFIDYAKRAGFPVPPPPPARFSTDDESDRSARR
jgi:TolB-like protein/DNA-binding winged helix-turn-helix (wHTH) protein/tetratricopeptide (TPR) repeat protein